MSVDRTKTIEDLEDHKWDDPTYSSHVFRSLTRELDLLQTELLPAWCSLYRAVYQVGPP